MWLRYAAAAVGALLAVVGYFEWGFRPRMTLQGLATPRGARPGANPVCDLDRLLDPLFPRRNWIPEDASACQSRCEPQPHPVNVSQAWDGRSWAETRASLDGFVAALESARTLEANAREAWAAGADRRTLARIARYWRSEYDPDATSRRLNAFEPSSVCVDGVVIHYLVARGLRVPVASKALATPKGGPAEPLLLLHGWPGSVLEFIPLLELWQASSSSSASSSSTSSGPTRLVDAFVPSLPGYGFSSYPADPRGLHTHEVALLFARFMRRVAGTAPYLVQGGDWGGVVAAALGQLDPLRCRGLHLNFFPMLPHKPSTLLRTLVAGLASQFAPAALAGLHAVGLSLSPADAARLNLPLDRTLGNVLMHTGYMHEQATFSDTLGVVAGSDPGPMMAWIVEKFHAWTRCHRDDAHGTCLDTKFTLDGLLGNVMIYWSSGSFASSLRLYRESLGDPTILRGSFCTVDTPTVVADFPEEQLLRIPFAWVPDRFPHLLWRSEMPAGGHFAALEEPARLLEDIQRFVAAVAFLPHPE